MVDHSGYEEDPFGCLVRTVRWLVAVTFGINAEAWEASRTVMRVYDSVRGALASVNVAFGMPAGIAYSASDSDLSRWVLATILDFMLETYIVMVGLLPRDDVDRFVCEWFGAGRLVGVTAERMWDGAGELCDYVDAEVQRLHPVIVSREAVWVVLHPSLPTRALRPVIAWVSFLTTGLLSQRLRTAYRLCWILAHVASHRAICASMR